jgi:hypothetical protein
MCWLANRSPLANSHSRHLRILRGPYADQATRCGVPVVALESIGPRAGRCQILAREPGEGVTHELPGYAGSALGLTKRPFERRTRVCSRPLANGEYQQPVPFLAGQADDRSNRGQRILQGPEGRNVLLQPEALARVGQGERFHPGGRWIDLRAVGQLPGGEAGCEVSC